MPCNRNREQNFNVETFSFFKKNFCSVDCFGQTADKFFLCLTDSACLVRSFFEL